MTKVWIIRELDDPIAEVRISLGSPPDSNDFYVVFRGDPEKVIRLLHDAWLAAQEALPKGKYKDDRKLMS